MARSAIINVMVQAAMKAGRSLSRDFGEVQNLQVSLKGPGDYVSQADRKAEQIIHAELSKARPGYAFLMEERGEVQAPTPAPLDCRSAGRNDQLPARHPDLRGFDRVWSGRAKSSPAWSTIRQWTSFIPQNVAAGRSSTTGVCGLRPATSCQMRS